MNVKYFGQYLLEKGYITRDQLLEGIKYQKAINLKIGVLAIDKSYMTSKQVEEVVSEQKVQNKKFGDLAIEKKYLTQAQLEDILSIQKSDRIFLGEALLEKGFINLEQLEKYLREYKKDQQKADSEVNTALNSINPRFAGLIKGSVEIFQNILIRLMDENGKISGCFEKTAKTEPADYMVSQKIFGEKNCIFALSLKSSTLCYISSKILKREIVKPDAYAEDGVKEFLNIVVGHICAALSNEGIRTETAPPLCVPYKSFKSDLTNATEIIVSLLMTDDDFDIHFIMS